MQAVNDVDAERSSTPPGGEGPEGGVGDDIPEDEVQSTSSVCGNTRACSTADTDSPIMWVDPGNNSRGQDLSVT